MLDELKQVAVAHPSDALTIVHVEIYEPRSKTGGKLVPVEAVADWQLPSEP